jgi:hypothetical protein
LVTRGAGNAVGEALVGASSQTAVHPQRCRLAGVLIGNSVVVGDGAAFVGAGKAINIILPQRFDG